jgi:hypothetical protein
MPAPIHLNIPEPCHENWQQMTPNEQGRHCLSCQKTVVDFTLMSDQEILNYISRATTSICGHFNNDQLNKTYAEKKIKPSFTFRYAWNMLVSAFLLSGSGAIAQSHKAMQGKVAASAGTQPKRSGKKKVKLTGFNRDWSMKFLNFKSEANFDFKGSITTLGFTVINTIDHSPTDLKLAPPLKIFGFVRDSSTKKSIGYASVRIKGIENGVAANEEGRYEIPLIDMGGQVTLVVSAIGYETKEYVTTVTNFQAGEILLTPAPDELTPVVVTAGNVLGKISRRVCTTTTDGELMAVQEVSRIQKIKRQMDDWMPGKKEVRIYPNPAAPGSSINISLDLKATGPYKLELMDAAGKIVHVQAMQVAQKEQLIQLPTQSSWSRGIYWVRISNGTDKKVYQAKVVLQ